MRRRRRNRRFPRRRLILGWAALLLWASPGALIVTSGLVLLLGAIFAVVWPGLRAGKYYDWLALAILGVDSFLVAMLALGVFIPQ